MALALGALERLTATRLAFGFFALTLSGGSAASLARAAGLAWSLAIAAATEASDAPSFGFDGPEAAT